MNNKSAYQEFSRILELLNLDIDQALDDDNIFSRNLDWYKSPGCITFRLAIKSTFFLRLSSSFYGVLMDLIVVSNVIYLVYRRYNHVSLSENDGNLIFLIIYITELLLGVFSHGFRNFWDDTWNKFIHVYNQQD